MHEINPQMVFARSQKHPIRQEILLNTQMMKNWEQLLTDPKTCDDIHDQHQYIFEAIAGKDPDMARNAAHSHLSYIGRSLKDRADLKNSPNSRKPLL